jgi:murein DD-endopeptidase MepM/ murein hydrolase activator NlpD
VRIILLNKRSGGLARLAERGISLWLVVPVLAGLVVLSALGGAWAYGQHIMSNLPTLVSLDVRQAEKDRLELESQMLNASLHQLGEKVGQLQARLIEMDGVSKRLAEVAGVNYTNPEVQETLNGSTVVSDDKPQAMVFDSAEALGRELDTMAQRLDRQRDGLAMLDMVMTRRAGLEASLPSLSPVDFPYMTSSYGWRRHPISGRNKMHEGLDFAAPHGAPIHAASGGMVVFAGYRTGYGKTVEIQHSHNLVTVYAHASSLQVKRGDLVEKGQLIANVGSTGQSTGPHLHFEVRVAGQPLDPSLFLPDPNEPEVRLADASDDLQADSAEVR